MENQTQSQVSEKSKAKNTLGIISLVSSIVAFAGCWIPILNILSIVIAIVGICLGIWSFINVLRKKVSSIALPIISVLLGVLAIIFASVMNNALYKSVSGGSTSSQTSNTESSSTNTNSTSSNNASSQTQKSYAVGESVETNGLKITYISVEDHAEKYLTPSSGNKYIALKFKAENVSTVDKNISYFSFKGYADDASIEQKYFDNGLSADLSAGKNTTGYVYFEVPKNAKNITAEYEVNAFTNEKIIFIVKKES